MLQIIHYRWQSSPKRGKEALVTVPNNKNCNQAQTHFQVLTKPKDIDGLIISYNKAFSSNSSPTKII